MRWIVLILCLLAAPVGAVEPDEILADPVLEQRARDLSKGLRCLVCRNEHIDASDATLARDLRLLVRERLVAGDTDEQVVSYIVERYGEFVLLNPPAKGSTLILWLAGPGMLVLAGGIAFVYLRGRRPGAITALSGEEQAELDKIMRQ
ncbi:cytochrome c-type biogenesis protein [Oceaniglobus ichthyenteri]|uniref:cytochrome c-type biogenesis protein n=1 Tax=Oceaniglobus ichthyenteri TaxID=2136177 RepID=UPI000D364766|nr:cytochrome c-type biogenesis protein [Oceaniglobus ichthyenteri]